MNEVLFLRRGYGLTQEEVSKELNISRKLLSLKEKNKRDWSKAEMIKLTELFKKHDKTLTLEKIFFEK